MRDALHERFHPRLVELGWSSGRHDETLSLYLIYLIEHGADEAVITDEVTYMDDDASEASLRDLVGWLFAQVVEVHEIYDTPAAPAASVDSTLPSLSDYVPDPNWRPQFLPAPHNPYNNSPPYEGEIIEPEAPDNRIARSDSVSAPSSGSKSSGAGYEPTDTECVCGCGWDGTADPAAPEPYDDNPSVSDHDAFPELYQFEDDEDEEQVPSQGMQSTSHNSHSTEPGETWVERAARLERNDRLYMERRGRWALNEIIAAGNAQPRPRSPPPFPASFLMYAPRARQPRRRFDFTRFTGFPMQTSDINPDPLSLSRLPFRYQFRLDRVNTLFGLILEARTMVEGFLICPPENLSRYFMMVQSNLLRLQLRLRQNYRRMTRHGAVCWRFVHAFVCLMGGIQLLAEVTSAQGDEDENEHRTDMYAWPRAMIQLRSWHTEAVDARTVRGLLSAAHAREPRRVVSQRIEDNAILQEWALYTIDTFDMFFTILDMDVEHLRRFISVCRSGNRDDGDYNGHHGELRTMFSWFEEE